MRWGRAAESAKGGRDVGGGQWQSLHTWMDIPGWHSLLRVEVCWAYERETEDGLGKQEKEEGVFGHCYYQTLMGLVLDGL